MRIAIMGAGGVGGYFGAFLGEAGNDVTFIARGAHLEAMRRDGLRLKGARGDASASRRYASWKRFLVLWACVSVLFSLFSPVDRSGDLI